MAQRLDFDDTELGLGRVLHTSITESSRLARRHARTVAVRSARFSLIAPTVAQSLRMLTTGRFVLRLTGA